MHGFDLVSRLRRTCSNREPEVLLGEHVRRSSCLLTTLIALVLCMAMPANAAPPSPLMANDQRTEAKHILIGQGMPRDLAATITSDPRATVTVDAGEVYIDGTGMDEILAMASNVVVSAAKGSDWWYAAALNSLGQPRTVVYVRYSWSWMWELRNHLSNLTTYANLMCGLLSSGGPTLVSACLLVVKAYMDLAGSKIKSGIAQGKCLRWRMTAPPVVDPSMLRWDLVRCRV